MTRRTFLKRSLATAAFFGCSGAAYAGEFERHGVRIETASIPIGLPRPIRAVLLTDIHFDPLYETDWLESVFRTVAGCAPDIVFHAGDYVSRSTARFEEFGAIAGRLRPPLGSFAVLGNHDHWSDNHGRRGRGRSLITRVLEQNGVRVLRNEIVPLPGHPGWALAGLDSFWAGRPDTTVFARAPHDTRFISIVHEPDAWDLLPDPRIRLQLSGHTHGGQVRLPLIGALRLPTWGRKYDAGLFEKGPRNLYVSRGIGTVNIPCRVNCAPEISLLELT